MAIEIKSVPILKNNVAKAFIKKAQAKSKKRAIIDFSWQFENATVILRKSNMQLSLDLTYAKKNYNDPSKFRVFEN
jgi:hypothetical protein